MANLKITELPTGSAYMNSSWQEGVEGGLNVKFAPSNTNPFRGDFDPTGDVLPSSGGRYTGGVPAIGDTWRLTADYKGWRGLVQAAVNNPSSESDWNFINLTTF
jgi:hypothetical protein